VHLGYRETWEEEQVRWNERQVQKSVVRLARIFTVAAEGDLRKPGLLARRVEPRAHISKRSYR
jgi:hypothetical protein